MLEFASVEEVPAFRFWELIPAMREGQESTANSTKAHATPNPAVAMGLSGNFKRSPVVCMSSLIVLAFRTVVFQKGRRFQVLNVSYQAKSDAKIPKARANGFKFT